MILRKHVVQIEQIEDSKFRANVTKDTYKLDNKLYRLGYIPPVCFSTTITSQLSRPAYYHSLTICGYSSLSPCFFSQECY